MNEKTAVLFDGSFFIKRYRTLVDPGRNKTPREVARAMYSVALKHVRKCKRNKFQLYRVFYYDCPPIEKRVQNPISGKGVNLKDSAEAKFRKAYFEELKRLRKVALRLGQLSDDSYWALRDRDNLKRLLSGKITRDDLSENDVIYRAKQTGVDMMIGSDIASLVYKGHVNQIVLIAGDSDFVPAAKLARREGVDFILDPMWNHIRPDLHEHIDGLQSAIPKPAFLSKSP